MRAFCVTRFNELRRIEAAIEHRNKAELQWALEYCRTRLGTAPRNDHQKHWRQFASSGEFKELLNDSRRRKTIAISLTLGAAEQFLRLRCASPQDDRPTLTTPEDGCRGEIRLIVLTQFLGWTFMRNPKRGLSVISCSGTTGWPGSRRNLKR